MVPVNSNGAFDRQKTAVCLRLTPNHIIYVN